MIAYWRRALRAQLHGQRTLFVLTVFGVALGIASVLAIQVINRSAVAAFQGGVEALSGDADLSVVPRVPTLPDSLLVVARRDPAVAAAWPMVEATAALQGRDQVFLDIVGADLYMPVRIPWEGPRGDPARALTVPGWAAISPDLAADLRVAVGDTIAVSVGTRPVTLRVGALVDFQRLTPLASRRLVVMDVAQAQALFGAPHGLSRIDLVLAPGAAPARVATRLGRALGPAVDVLRPAQRTARAENLLSAFRLNLTALSLISLVVGFFLVHSGTQAALVRRRLEFGILRATGATRRQVLALILGEVALLGAAGVLVGVPLGLWAARANVGRVSATISNLYLLDAIERIDVPVAVVAGAALLGVAAALAGAAGPALDTSRRDVRALLASLTLHERAAARAVPLLGAAALLLAAAFGWALTLGREVKPAGFVLSVAVLAAVPLAAPWLVQRVTGALPVRRFGVAFALRGLGARLHATAFAVSSLAIAVAMMVGITIMVGSFRETVALWLEASLRADVYVTTPSWRGAGPEGTLDSVTVRTLLAMPGVARADRLRGFTVMSGPRPIALAGVDMALPGGAARFPLFAGDTASAMAAARHGAVIISEPLSRKAHLGVGDSLPITTPTGERRYRIAGVSYDYATETGAAAMDLATLAAAFGPGPVNSVALYLAPGRDAERMVDAIRARLPGVPLTVRSNRTLKGQAFRIFDETFAITRLLQLMALLVAVTGITLTLLILARERAQELAVYRALGATRAQVFRVFVAKGVGLAAMGFVGGAAAGGALAAILIYGINRAYFGWTIQVHVPWGTLGSAAALMLAAAVAASLYPAARAGATPAAQLSRDDA